MCFKALDLKSRFVLIETHNNTRKCRGRALLPVEIRGVEIPFMHDFCYVLVHVWNCTRILRMVATDRWFASHSHLQIH